MTGNIILLATLPKPLFAPGSTENPQVSGMISTLVMKTLESCLNLGVPSREMVGGDKRIFSRASLFFLKISILVVYHADSRAGLMFVSVEQQIPMVLFRFVLL